MTDLNIKQVYDAKPTTVVPDDALFYLGLSPYNTSSDSAIKKQDLFSQLNVSFNRNLYIASNGNDTTGTIGSLSKPFATGPAAEAAILALTPSSTNAFLIIDQRIGVINEAVTFIPFVIRKGNGLGELNGNWSMHSSFSTIATPCFSGISDYKSLGNTTPGNVVFNFSALSTTNQISITLQNFEKAVFTGSYIGNNAANFTSLNFVINEINFNTSGRNTTGNTYWRADIDLSSGLKRRIRYSDGQISTITKSLGSVTASTELDVAFCGQILFDPVTDSLNLINSGGNNQPSVVIRCLSCQSPLSLGLDIINDGSSPVSIITDITVDYFINSFNSLTNIYFQNYSYVDNQRSFYVPTNYTRTAYTSDGFDVTTAMLGSQFKGIDDALSTLSGSGESIEGLNLLEIGNTDLTIDTGSCSNSNNTSRVNVTSQINIDASLSGAGGLDTGSLAAATWYGAYLIWEAADPTNFDGIISLNNGKGTVPAVLPAPYDKARFLGSVKTATGVAIFLPYEQSGSNNDRACRWASGDTALTVATARNDTSPTAISCTGAVSPTSNLCLGLNYAFNVGTTASNSLNLYMTTDLVDAYQAISPGIVAIINTGVTQAIPVDSSHNFYASINTTAGTATYTLRALGFMESI